MEFLKKIVTGSLIVALASFAGSFCLHPMAVQAASIEDMAMGVSQNGSDASSGGCIADSSDEVAGVATCISDCVTTVPQAVAAKKTSADSLSNVLAIVSQSEQPQFLELYSDPLDVTGTDPPSPDILSSVVKIE
ncbi:MAG: hypothetical protein Q8Q10_03710 [bacterium]|nr:hypothetical protein [bacterium]